MKKKRRQRKNKNKKPAHAKMGAAQKPDAEARSAAGKKGPGLVMFAGLLAVALAIAFYVVRSSETPQETDDQQAVLAPSEIDSSEKAARVPLRQTSSWTELDDPASDGWDTEVFAEKAKKQLVALGKIMVDVEEVDAADVKKLIAKEFACEPLRPANLVAVHDDPHLKIERAPSSSSGLSSLDQLPESEEQKYHGADGLVQALRDAAASFAEAEDLRFEVKIFRVFPAPGKVTTRQYFSITGHTESGTLEQHATWDIGWEVGTGKSKPHLQWIRVEEFEQSESRNAEETLFADCTESVLGGNDCYTEQFLRGMNYWYERIQDRSPFGLFANPGLAVGDVNGDGLDDLYVCQEAGLPNRLFVQNPDGSATDQSTSWGVDWLESSRSALLVDLDNDSDQDLVVAILGGVVVAENNGQGQFQIRDVLATCDDTMSLTAVDYDMDGRLDIYVCAYHQNKSLDSTELTGMPGAAEGFVVHDANNGGNNSLFRNLISKQGEWQFEDVTKEVGLDEKNYRWSLAAAWDDYDKDGDQDLYVANDYGRDHFYRNDLLGSSSSDQEQNTGPQFVDISDLAHVEDSATGMSITWGDYDRDGWMDALVSNMWSSAGQRVTYQNNFKPDAPQDIKNRYQRQARGNTLLKNQGDGTFSDLSGPAGIEMGRWAWGSRFADLNNDGWEDLFVSNGYITADDTGDL